MVIEEINEEEYSRLSELSIRPYERIQYLSDGTIVLPSPNNLYELHLIYCGEFPHGDSYYDCKIIHKLENRALWEYYNGRPIRQFAWSEDSETCYFSLINNGNSIWKFEIKELAFVKIYSPSVSNMLVWLSKVSIIQNSLIFYTQTFSNKDSWKTDYFYYDRAHKKTINLSDYIEMDEYEVEYSLNDKELVIIGSNQVVLFNVESQKIIEIVSYPITLGKWFYSLLIQTQNTIILRRSVLTPFGEPVLTGV